MLSKMLPWDFFPKYPTVINQKKPGLYAFLVEDPFLERVLLDAIPKKEIHFSLYSGMEITRDFIEEHLVNLSFFSSTDHIQVMNAENVSSANLEFLLDANLDWSERFLLLFFTKSSKAFLEFAKNNQVEAFHIEEPRFWEGAKLWQFCQKMRGVNFPADVSRFIMDSSEHTFESFFWAIDMIRLNFPDGKLNLSELQLVIKKERWDYFELIDIFNENPKKFFQEVIKKELDYSWLQMLFSLMQGHLSKILFPEEIKSKGGKLNKYDQSILLMSERAKKEEIISYLRVFSDLEIQAKLKDELILNNLRKLVFL